MSQADGEARQVSEEERFPVQHLAPWETSVRQSWKEAWTAMVDIPGENKSKKLILIDF